MLLITCLLNIGSKVKCSKVSQINIQAEITWISVVIGRDDFPLLSCKKNPVEPIHLFKLRCNQRLIYFSPLAAPVHRVHCPLCRRVIQRRLCLAPIFSRASRVRFSIVEELLCLNLGGTKHKNRSFCDIKTPRYYNRSSYHEVSFTWAREKCESYRS